MTENQSTLPGTPSYSPTRTVRKSKYVIQTPDESVANAWVDLVDTPDFDDTAEAMSHIRKHYLTGTFRIVAIKREFEVHSEQVAKLTVTDIKA